MKILTDVHTHTTFSADGHSSIFEQFARAKELGITYWGISEHFDYDYFVDNICYEGEVVAQTDAEKYFFTARKLQDENKNDMHILVGAECGFTRNRKVDAYYQSMIERFSPDFVVNSVHTNGKLDYFEAGVYEGKTKQEVYDDYLDLVRESLDVPYHYDIVAHIGYPTRAASYLDRVMHYADHAQKIDDILQTIIRKGKILEVNTSVKGLDTPFLPFVEIVERYYQLGGRAISYASDGHSTDRLCLGRERAVSELKRIGFTYITVPFRGKHIKVEI